MSITSDAGKQLASLQQQMSMTNYADVDENSNGGISSIVSNLPFKMKGHPMLEKPKRPKNEGKPVKPLEVRNSRLDEISKGMGELGQIGGAHSKLQGHDPSRTL